MSTRIVTTGALLAKTLAKTALTHAMLSARLTRTVTVSAVVSGRTQTVPVSAMLRATVIQQSSATGVLLGTVQGTFAGNTVLVGGITRTFIMNSVIKRGRRQKGQQVLSLAAERTFVASAVLFPETTQTRFTTVGTLVLQRQASLKTLTVSAVKVPQVLAHTKLVTASALLSRLGARLGVGISAVLLQSEARTPKRPFSSFSARNSRR